MSKAELIRYLMGFEHEDLLEEEKKNPNAFNDRFDFLMDKSMEYLQKQKRVYEKFNKDEHISSLIVTALKK